MGIFGLHCTDGTKTVNLKNRNRKFTPASVNMTPLADPFEFDKEVIWIGNLLSNHIVQKQKKILEATENSLRINSFQKKLLLLKSIYRK